MIKSKSNKIGANQIKKGLKNVSDSDGGTPTKCTTNVKNYHTSITKGCPKKNTPFVSSTPFIL